MATPRKVNEYMIVTQVEPNYRLMVQGCLQQVSLDALCKGNHEGALLIEIQIKFQDRILGDLVELMRKLMGELFTDEELDELMAFHSRPVAQKIREQIPIVQQEALNMFSTLDQERILKEILAEYE